MVAAAGIADAGWVEVMNIPHPIYNDQFGYMEFDLYVQGNLFASDPSGAAGLFVGADSPIGTQLDYSSGFLFSGLANQVTGDFSKVVAETVTPKVRIRFGEDFDLIVRALARAGVSGTPTGSGSSANVDFGNTIYWGGIRSITVDNLSDPNNPIAIPLDTITITTASGTDYSRSFVPSGTTSIPEPSMILSFLGLGLAGLTSKLRAFK